MGKVIRLFNDQDAKQEALVAHIEQLLAAAKNGELKNLLVAAEVEEGIYTGYCNLDVAEKQYMLSHVQVDINFEVVKVNMEDLIEWV